MTCNHLLLYRLAELILEHEHYMLPVDLLFDDEQIGIFVKSIQIDSPYQQMLLEGVLTETVREEKLYVSFTVEGYFHFVLGEVIKNHFFSKGDQGWRYIVNLIDQSSFSHVDMAVSQFFVNQVNNGELTFIHPTFEWDFDKKKILTPAIVQTLLLDFNNNFIFKIDEIKLWEEILQKLIQNSKYELASKCIIRLDINISKNLLTPDLLPHLNFELLQSVQKKLINQDTNYALEFYLGQYQNLTTHYLNTRNQILLTEVDLLFVASAFIDIGKSENAIEILGRHNRSNNNFIERCRLKSIAFNGLSLNREAVESISIAINKSNEQYGQYHFKTAELINLKGLYSLAQGAFQEAINCFENSARIYKKVKGESNFEYATIINNIGLVLFHKSDYQSAIEQWEKAISVLSSLGMQSHPETANIYKSLAYCYEKLGYVANALFNIETALNILNENNLQYSEAALKCKQIINRISQNDH